MNLLQISWKSLVLNPLTSLLNIMLIAFGTGILCLILLASDQIGEKLSSNSKDIDLVVGAKGSPLQLILSSIYHIDFPTGNISLNEANKLTQNPMVKRAVPLALGDSYNGFRIVGTDTSFVNLYNLKLANGEFWQGPFEITIGSVLAETQNLKVGDKVYGAHGLTDKGDVHNDHSYTVTGILSRQNNVTDNLILTSIGSILKMHGLEGNESTAANHDDSQITALLIQYRSPMSVVLFPRMVNESTNMQAASPARESARLFSLLGVGLDALKWFAILIMLIAMISVFVSLYNSLKERKYDLAVMRSLGASKAEIFSIIMLEGIILTLFGSLAGLVLGHGVLELIGQNQDSIQAQLSGFNFRPEETYLIMIGFSTGIIASLIPAIQAFRSDISRTLSKN
ncbi:FtsX-like permease family protein [Pedobacter sp. P351]|uniref:ABC transporter permease n=1 Tax=Pedobacter superstes TaxID=3133441 RepID=UPI0030B727CA